MLILMPKSIELSVVYDEAAERHLDKSVGNRILKFFVDMVTQESSDFSNFSWLLHQLEKNNTLLTYFPIRNKAHQI